MPLVGVVRRYVGGKLALSLGYNTEWKVIDGYLQTTIQA